MKKTLNKKADAKYHRIDDTQRNKIQFALDNRIKLADIAKELELPSSTVSREIARHLEIIPSKHNDCLYAANCQERFACKRKCGQKLCRRCKAVVCYRHCSNYVRKYCPYLEKAPHVCNGCTDTRKCVYEKQYYRAHVADEQATDNYFGRKGDTLFTDEQLKQIDSLISPLIIKKHQSPSAALTAVKDDLKRLGIKLSLATLYRLINTSKIEARPIHLPEAVGRRKRRTSTKKKQGAETYAVMKVDKTGHMYEDFLEYQKFHKFTRVEMDCVEGRKTDTAVILSLHWKSYHMQLYYILDAHDAVHVVGMLDVIEESIGLELFKECMPVILTDNGEEFTDIDGMERSCTEPGEKRTKIFFCEPNRSDQKGSAERNHKMLRRIIPKYTNWKDSRNRSIQELVQSDMVLVTNHVNSYPRPKMKNIRPYDLAFKALPEDFFVHLGLEMIPKDEVNLAPSLIYNKAS